MKKALFKSVMVLSSTLMLLIPFTGLADDYLFADVNRDGEVNISDINMVIDVILGKPINPPQETKTFMANGVSFTMVQVNGGTFNMGALEGDNEAKSDEYPVHEVTLSTYYIGQTEVTQELWLAVMDTIPSYFTNDMQHPVERVSWDDCKEFIRKLSILTGQQFCLPTEAQWEFAARGGNLSNGYKYAGSNDINEVAWWGYEKGGNSDYTTHPVGCKNAPNELGLHDMSGNVAEWCNDWYGGYEETHQHNPKGPYSGYYHVIRGGSWSSVARSCRVTNRYNNFANYKHFSVGLRLAISQLQ